MSEVKQPEVAKPSKREEQRSTVQAILTKYKVAAEAQTEILALFEAKTGGVKLDPNEFTVFAEDGVTQAFILCSVVALWFPATASNFYLNDGVVKYRTSKHGERLKKELTRTIKASKDAILNDVINGVITPEEGKSKVAELDALTIVVPEDVKALGFVKRPLPGAVVPMPEEPTTGDVTDSPTEDIAVEGMVKQPKRGLN